MAEQIEFVSSFGLRLGSRFHRLRTRFRNIFGYYRILIAVAAPFATAVTGLFWINEKLPVQIAFKVPDVVSGTYFVTVCIIATFLVGLTMVSAYVIQDMHLSREREQSFNYDKHGTLFNGDVPNVAFRVSTVKTLFGELARALGPDKSAEVVGTAGRAVGKDFAKDLSAIMDRDVLVRARWDELSFNSKLDEWALYDSATGWGLVSARLTARDKVVVRISHFRHLFEGDGGEAFTYFLSGYCEAVVSAIVEGHREGVLEDYKCAVITHTRRIEDDLVEFNFDLR
jgi:hypothetical protein